MNKTIEGLLFECSAEGLISKILYNDFGAEFRISEGMLFIDIFRKESIQNALDFFTGIKSGAIEFGRTLQMKVNGDSSKLNFGGVLLSGRILIMGSKAEVNSEKFLSGLMVLNNEQTNTIRSLTKSRSSQISTEGSTAGMYDQFTKLNNELIEAQRELFKKNNELIRLGNIKNQLMGIAAHDLRNPLSYIISYCELLSDSKDNLTNDQAEMIERIKGLSTFMITMVHDLLDYSAIESGEVNLKISDINLAEVIAEVVSLNRFAANKKKIQINESFVSDKIPVRADKDKIIQVVTNLLTNAIKYSPEGSSIKVKTTIQKNSVEVYVEDKGQGIKRDELKMLFKPFQVTSSKSTGGERSTGLGLFIVRKIVEAHGGSVFVESEPGRGSSFGFSLPLII